MSRKKVFITAEIFPEAKEILSKHFDVEVSSKESLTEDEILENSKEIHGLLSLITDPITKKIINSSKNLEGIANYGVGHNNIDIEAANEQNITVTNTPEVLTDATADLAWALLMAAARKIVPSDEFTRAGKFTGWGANLFLGADIKGKTLGVIGAGRIGQTFAKRSLGFDMKILYHNRSRNRQFEDELNAQYVDKETLLKESDFISLHAPLTEQTYHMIGESELEMMKDSAILINTARGSMIDEKALVLALKQKKIWAAGLDVFEREPQIEAGLKELDNVVLAPHIGSATFATRRKMAEIAAKNLVRILNGKEPLTPVN
ncbi:D-glycerate dehydrogenase [Proteinivorax hydrogeniformans]|uniref:D-glycerate dehydrogenase n=1 Tax=Proteinivorax hydrogeniformans TaxID=1826727 RepID=A0AAU8HVU0_9FIRM